MTPLQKEEANKEEESSSEEDDDFRSTTVVVENWVVRDNDVHGGGKNYGIVCFFCAVVVSFCFVCIDLYTEFSTGYHYLVANNKSNSKTIAPAATVDDYDYGESSSLVGNDDVQDMDWEPTPDYYEYDHDGAGAADNNRRGETIDDLWTLKDVIPTAKTRTVIVGPKHPLYWNLPFVLQTAHHRLYRKHAPGRSFTATGRTLPTIVERGVHFNEELLISKVCIVPRSPIDEVARGRHERRVHFEEELVSQIFIVPRSPLDEVARGRREKSVHFEEELVSQVFIVPRSPLDEVARGQNDSSYASLRSTGAIVRPTERQPTPEICCGGDTVVTAVFKRCMRFTLGFVSLIYLVPREDADELVRGRKNTSVESSRHFGVVIFPGCHGATTTSSAGTTLPIISKVAAVRSIEGFIPREDVDEVAWGRKVTLPHAVSAEIIGAVLEEDVNEDDLEAKMFVAETTNQSDCDHNNCSGISACFGDDDEDGPDFDFDRVCVQNTVGEASTLMDCNDLAIGDDLRVKNDEHEDDGAIDQVCKGKKHDIIDSHAGCSAQVQPLRRSVRLMEQRQRQVGKDPVRDEVKNVIQVSNDESPFPCGSIVVNGRRRSVRCMGNENNHNGIIVVV